MDLQSKNISEQPKIVHDYPKMESTFETQDLPSATNLNEPLNNPNQYQSVKPVETTIVYTKDEYLGGSHEHHSDSSHQHHSDSSQIHHETSPKEGVWRKTKNMFHSGFSKVKNLFGHHDKN